MDISNMGREQKEAYLVEIVAENELVSDIENFKLGVKRLSDKILFTKIQYANLGRLLRAVRSYC